MVDVEKKRLIYKHKEEPSMAHTAISAVNLMIIKYTAEVLIIGISRFDLSFRSPGGGEEEESDKDKRIARKKKKE
jgi:hypothetical protein